MVGSRFCSGAESRYAAIEGQLAAIVWALEKTRIFTLGARQLIVVSDHKPLVNILKNIKNESETIRISRLKHTIVFLDVWYIKGTKNAGPDALSRQYVNVDKNVCKLSREDVVEKYKSCNVIQKILSYVVNGFPKTKSEMERDTQTFWNYRLSLNVKDNLLFYNDRLVIPNPLKKQILKMLHGAHQGTRGMELRASRCVFWPGMKADIKKTRDNCLSCNESQPSNPNLPPVAIKEPAYPFQDICIDYCQYAGFKYGVMVDRYSGWPAVWLARDRTFSEWLIEFCTLFGIPEIISTDGGPEFHSNEVQEILNDFGIRHRVSSAYNPHSNSRAEIGVKSMKRLLRDNIDVDGALDSSRFINAMLTYKNTPCRDMGMSPAEIVLGRNVSDFFPEVAGDGLMNLDTPWREKLLYREAALSTRRSNDNKKWSEHTKKLEDLDIGDHVMIQNGSGNSPLKWEKNGVVVSYEGFDKYGIRVDGSRRLTFRNRKHLRKFVPFYPDPDVSDGVANNNLKRNDDMYTEYKNLISNDSDTAHTNFEIRKPDPFDQRFEKVEQNTGRPNIELRQNYIENVPINDNMYYNDSVNMPSNNVTHESSAIEPIIPSVIERESDRRENGKMPTPAVRRSERQNKGTNERLRADYEVYDISYCYACKCKLGASATKYPTSCDFRGGG